MITGKKLFAIMIKYYSIIISRMIDRDMIHEESDGILLSNAENINNITNNSSDNQENTKYSSNSIINVYECWQKDNLMEIRTNNIHIFDSVSTPIYHIVSSNRFFTSPDILQNILLEFSNDIEYLRLPPKHYIPTIVIPQYLSIIKKQVAEILDGKGGNGCWSGYNKYFFYPYIGLDDSVTPSITYVSQYGIWAYKPLYYEILWNFDMVEKYKDLLCWTHLIENSNLTWSEEMLTKYESYIPHKDLGAYHQERNFWGHLVYYDSSGYGKMGLLSNDYLIRNKDIINWSVFAKTGMFHWSPEDLKFFYNNARWSRGQETPCYRADDKYFFDMEELSENNRIEWTPELFKAMIEVDPSSLNYCIKNNFFLDLLHKIPNYISFVEQYNKDPDFWRIVKDRGRQPHNAYSEYFNIKDIQMHIQKKDWDVALEEKYNYTRRTPDTNYHHYTVYTMWDFFNQNKAVHLTYELSKYLKSITITLGGSYVVEDSCTPGEDNRYPQKNGLEVFAHHLIANETEIERILMDDDLLSTFLSFDKNNINIGILDYIIDMFFLDFEIKEYISIINKFIINKRHVLTE